MTVNYKDNSFAVIRSFLWDKLIEYKILSENDYIADGFDIPLVPIIPVQQIPEFNNLIGDKPYIIYTVDTLGYSDAWWICEERITFSVVSSDYGKIIEIGNFIIDLFRRMDDTAKDINDWKAVSSNFNFYTFILDYVSSPAPFTEEGGRQIADIEMTYKYSRNLGNNGRFL